MIDPLAPRFLDPPTPPAAAATDPRPYAGAAAGLQHDLFDPVAGDRPAGPWPDGLRYELGFLDAAEEAALLALIATLPLAPARHRDYEARRRVAWIGVDADDGHDDAGAVTADGAVPWPAPLQALRQRAAAWGGVAPEALVHALVSEYRPGTPLGWHRDRPQFGTVIGVSLAAPARMRFRPLPGRAAAPVGGRRGAVPALDLTLAPRSIYLLRGDARWRWQHAVAPTERLRYSVTLRTLAPPSAAAAATG